MSEIQKLREENERLSAELAEIKAQLAAHERAALARKSRRVKNEFYPLFNEG